MGTLPPLIVGADHNGFRLKTALKAWLVRRGYTVSDVGASRPNPRDDYPVYAALVSRAVAAGRGLGLLICGSGHGMVIAANRFSKVRAALSQTPLSATRARHDDHANVLVLAAWEITEPRARRVIAAWLDATPSRINRHRRRLKMLERLTFKNPKFQTNVKFKG